MNKYFSPMNTQGMKYLSSGSQFCHQKSTINQTFNKTYSPFFSLHKTRGGGLFYILKNWSLYRVNWILLNNLLTSNPRYVQTFLFYLRCLVLQATQTIATCCRSHIRQILISIGVLFLNMICIL